jgi:uncharacterized protein
MLNEELRFGLKERTINQINQVFKLYPDIDKVVLYGSRAKGTYRNGSDIDLTIISDNLTYEQLNRIETQLDELSLPYSIDLSLFQHIDNPGLIEHINRIGQVFYKPSNSKDL